MEMDPEVASIVGSTISGIYASDVDEISLILDNGRVVTFAGTFEIYLTDRTIQ